MKTSGTLPSGFKCHCGIEHKYPPYVYGHWDIELQMTCSSCQRQYALLRGKASEIIQAKGLVKEMINRKVAALIIVGTALLFTLAVARSFAVPSKPRPNSLGITEIYQNPNTYLVAEPVEVTFMRDEKERIYTNVRFQPLNTAAYYDESILLCGVIEDFKHLPMAIIYTTRSGRMYKGIACHEFVSAYEVK